MQPIGSRISTMQIGLRTILRPSRKLYKSIEVVIHQCMDGNFMLFTKKTQVYSVPELTLILIKRIIDLELQLEKSTARNLSMLCYESFWVYPKQLILSKYFCFLQFLPFKYALILAFSVFLRKSQTFYLTFIRGRMRRDNNNDAFSKKNSKTQMPILEDGRFYFSIKLALIIKS